jgi:F-type H+-transporting ATPase subunit a
MNSTLSLESNVKVVNLYNDILSPLEQFEIRDLLSLDALGNLHISITNIGFYLTVGAIFIFMLNILSTNYNKLVSNN